jgi:uncharacterized protein YbjT (DUF2867 family)
MSSILVIGGTGTVGSATVESLTSKGQSVRVLTRSPDEATLPAGATAVGGDLAKPDSLKAAFDGIERLCLITPLDRDEAAKGKTVVDMARQALVRRIVFMSIHQVETCPEAPHFLSKIEIEGAIRGTGIPFTIVRPNNFFQNDLQLREAILAHGVYPQPLGSKGCSRVHTDDVAECLARALVDDGHEGKYYSVAGRQTLSGQDCARAWSDALGQEVTYAGDSLDAWADNAAHTLPDWLVEDLRVMYDCFQRNGLAATDDELANQRRLLGREPQRYDEWVFQVARDWKG